MNNTWAYFGFAFKRLGKSNDTGITIHVMIILHYQSYHAKGEKKKDKIYNVTFDSWLACSRRSVGKTMAKDFKVAEEWNS